MWVSKLKKKEGFTLVEFLIVILIVGVLSTLAVSGYTNYRKAALLDLAADNIVSQVYELRDRSIHGDFGSVRADSIEAMLSGLSEGVVLSEDAGEARCFGVVFEALEGGAVQGFVTNTFSEEFVGRKIYEGNNWVYEGCDDTSAEMKVLELGDQVVVEKVAFYNDKDDQVDVKSLKIRFIPSDGEMEILVDGDKYDFKGQTAYKQLLFRIKYGVTEDEKFMRNLLFDLTSQNFEVSKI